jgi:capsular polysaccharide biosynthesis protein
MTEQSLNLRKSLQILRRHLVTLVMFTALGALAGAGYAAMHPPTYSSSAFVVLPTSTRNVPTQIVIATSVPVLANALGSVHPAMSLSALTDRVEVTTPISWVLSVNAQGQSPVQAESIANAVARSYVAYTNATGNQGGHLQAAVLRDATYTAATPFLVQLLVTAITGAMAGVVAGTVVVLAVGRGYRRLRLRDEMADAIGVPVLASVQVRHPSDVVGWTRLLEGYQPDAADSWRFRNALSYLGLADILSADADTAGRPSVTVVSFASDRGALGLGPQLAVFAAAQGVRTELVINPRQDNSTAALCAACEPAPSSKWPSQLRATIADQDDLARSGAVLTIVVAVVDDQSPQIVDAWRTDATLLGVSSGTVTAEQLVRAAASAAADSHHIAGILVADPDPADQTTGRFPQLERPIKNSMPTRLAGTLTVTRW